MSIRKHLFFGVLATLLLGTSFQLPAKGQYLSQEDFLAMAFEGDYSPGRLWLNKELKAELKKILGHDVPGLRIRYWAQGTRTAWILEEIGKERPITIGIVVGSNGIEMVRILAFRESRGWEVRYPFFSDQFTGSILSERYKLSRSIDGISGATLSVRAVKRASAAALFMHQQTDYAKVVEEATVTPAN